MSANCSQNDPSNPYKLTEITMPFTEGETEAREESQLIRDPRTVLGVPQW